jgi:hypothetical protein
MAVVATVTANGRKRTRPHSQSISLYLGGCRDGLFWSFIPLSSLARPSLFHVSALRASIGARAMTETTVATLPGYDDYQRCAEAVDRVLRIATYVDAGLREDVRQALREVLVGEPQRARVATMVAVDRILKGAPAEHCPLCNHLYHGLDGAWADFARLPRSNRRGNMERAIEQAQQRLMERMQGHQRVVKVIKERGEA